jgi:PAS domain S-box-containing protein
LNKNSGQNKGFIFPGRGRVWLSSEYKHESFTMKENRNIDKTKDQLLAELTTLHRRMAALKASNTKLKKTKARLYEKGERFKTIFEGAAIGIGLTSPDQKVVESNPALQQMLGYSQEELHRMHFPEFTHPEDVPKEVALWEEVIAGKRDQIQVEKRFCCKDGSIIWANLTGSVLRNSGGEAEFLIGTAQDITSRKRAEAIFRAIFEGVGIGMALSGLDGKALETNLAFQQMIGYSEEELRRIHFAEFTHPDDLPQELILIKEIVEGKRNHLQFEKRYIRKDGTIIWVNLTGSLLYGPGGEPQFFVAIAEDITPRKRAEAHIKAMFEGVGIGMWLTNLQGIAVQTNRALQEMLGYTEEELHQIPYSAYTHPDDLPKELVLVREVIEGKRERLQIEKRFLKKDGAIIWANLTGSLLRGPGGEPQFLIGTAEDISQRKHAEAQFKAIFEGVGVGMALSGLDGVAIKGNRALQEMLDYSEEELCNIHFSKFTHPDDLPKELALIKEVVEGKRDHMQFEKRYLRKDGTVVWGNAICSLLRGPGGEPQYLIGTVEDITQRKNTEEKLLIYQEQLRSLASELSLAEERERRRIAVDFHDHVAQTLSLSRMKLEALRESVTGGNVAESLDGISELVEQAIQEVRSLILELSPPVLYELGFEAAVEWLADRMYQHHGVMVKLKNDGQSKPLDNEVQGVLFRSLGELLINVVKHARTRRAEVSIRRSGHTIRITVKDNGAGFNPSEIKGQNDKTGAFGLFSIRERLNHFGGYLDIRSEPGRGTRATLVAPLKT